MNQTSPLFPPAVEGAVAWQELIRRLAQPFPAVAVQWRAGSVSRDRKRAQALPYVDPRLYEDRLDQVCSGDWSVIFRPWDKNRVICELTIRGVTRASTGEFDEDDRVAQGTAAEAQAFKRACSKFGLGRYLYDIPIVWVDYDEERRRLAETPELEAPFVPLADDVPSFGRSREPEVPSPEDTLSPERADAMRRELENLGVPVGEQLRFASGVLGRRVDDLTGLTDAEALRVWKAARRNSHDLAV